LKIAYIIEWDPYIETGVIRKIISQVQAMRGIGADVIVFALVPIKNEKTVDGFDELGKVIGIINQNWLDKLPYARFGFWNKVLSTFKLKRVLKEYQPDLIYYRQQGPWFPGLCSLLKCAPSAMELNTLDRVEIKMRGKLLSFLYLLTHQMIVTSVKALIAVSHEIAKDYQDAGKPIAVIANGFWQSFTPLPPTENKAPQFVFVGTPNGTSECWHGTDKIIFLARQMPEALFHIIGPDRNEFASTPENVIVYGYLNITDIVKVYQKCDVGIGTLALHRKAMDEASPLKTREYLSYGMPLIKGYTDTDEQLNHDDTPYILDVGNYEMNIEEHVEEIKRFSYSWVGHRVVGDFKFLMAEEKEFKRLAFFHEMIGK